MAARESTRVHRKYKTKYCVTNWRESRYRRQGAVENLFFRYKRALGDSLRACGYESQKREAMIGCNVLNRMAELGKPESQAIVEE